MIVKAAQNVDADARTYVCIVFQWIMLLNEEYYKIKANIEKVTLVGSKLVFLKPCGLGLA